MAFKISKIIFQASRAFTHPQLVKFNHTATQTKPLAMLNNMEVIPYGGGDVDKTINWDKPKIPFYAEMLDANDFCVAYKITAGRTLYMFVKDAGTLQK